MAVISNKIIGRKEIGKNQDGKRNLNDKRNQMIKRTIGLCLHFPFDLHHPGIQSAKNNNVEGRMYL